MIKNYGMDDYQMFVFYSTGYGDINYNNYMIKKGDGVGLFNSYYHQGVYFHAACLGDGNGQGNFYKQGKGFGSGSGSFKNFAQIDSNGESATPRDLVYHK
jgi:hypothetical protein